MKLNGAFEPQQGASLIGSSIGAKKYRDKQCKSDANNDNNVALTGVLALDHYSGSNNNINTNSSCHFNSNNSKFKERIKRAQYEQVLQLQQEAKITSCYFSTSREDLLHETSKLIKNYCNTNNSNYNCKNNNSKQVNAKSIAKKAKANTTIPTPASEFCKAENNVIMNVLLGAVTILLSSFTNNNVNFNSTAWFKSYGIGGLVRVQKLLLWVSTRALTLMATTKAPIANITSKTIMSRSHAAIPTKLASVLCLSAMFMLLPGRAHCNEIVPSMFPETEEITTEFDYASRGNKKFGDKCERTIECGFPGSICDPKLKSCQCTEDLPITNHFDKCGKEAAINESCFFHEQCEAKYYETECKDNRCGCRFEMMPIWNKDGSVECKARRENNGEGTYIDPAMIGVLVGMALMFIIICVVLRLFSQARWRENRTIFNTPNPRLMNVSLLRESKLVHGQERRGSRMSVRAPSRQPSMASLRPHSPNPSLGKSGSASNSHGSNASAASLRSTRSNSVAPGNIGNGQQERQSTAIQPQSTLSPTTTTNITANPVAESITVEIIEVKK